jgi:hypothetical protein
MLVDEQDLSFVAVFCSTIYRFRVESSERRISSNAAAFIQFCFLFALSPKHEKDFYKCMTAWSHLAV